MEEAKELVSAVAAYNKSVVKKANTYISSILNDNGLGMECIVTNLKQMLLGSSSDRRFALAMMFSAHMKQEDVINRKKEQAQKRAFEIKKAKILQETGLKNDETAVDSQEFKNAEEALNKALAQVVN